jgi:ComF family protein
VTVRFAYAGPLADAILRAKNDPDPWRARALGALLVPPSAPVEGVLAVPLHPRRLRARGFNQSVELARSLVGCGPLRFGALVRVRDTPQQQGLGREARRSNLLGAFAVPDPRRVRGMRLALVDDVVTTGSTFEAARQALLSAGAREVHPVALASAGF